MLCVRENGDDDDIIKCRDFDVLSEFEVDIVCYVEVKVCEMSVEEVLLSVKVVLGVMDGVKEVIDMFLLYDFFVILFILAWFVVGVGVWLSKGNGLLYDELFLGMWLFLWLFLF